jgi:hypothetical protein
MPTGKSLIGFLIPIETLSRLCYDNDVMESSNASVLGTVRMNAAFPHSYGCEQAREVQGSVSSALHYYPTGPSQGGKDGMLVEVRPAQSEPWFGLFAFGHFSPNCPSGIFTTPDADRFCVVAQGQGYFVSAEAPELWDCVKATPIMNIYPVPRHGIIVFAEFTRLVAYGQAGLRWKTKRLAWESMNITEVTDEFIGGNFWDLRTEATVRFKVNLATGDHEGGIE